MNDQAPMFLCSSYAQVILVALGYLATCL